MSLLEYAIQTAGSLGKNLLTQAKDPYSFVQLFAATADRGLKISTLPYFIENTPALRNVYESTNLIEHYLLQLSLFPATIIVQNSIKMAGHYTIDKFNNERDSLDTFIKRSIKLQGKQVRNTLTTTPLAVVPTAFVAEYFGLEAGLLIGGASIGFFVGLLNNSSRSVGDKLTEHELFSKIGEVGFRGTMKCYTALPEYAQELCSRTIRAFS